MFYLRQARLLLSTAAALALSGGAAALEDGVDYYLIPEAELPPSEGPVEITYYFNFACPACFAFEGPLQLWLEEKDEGEIQMGFVPVPWERTSQLYAQAFYVMEGLDRLDLIRPFFDALHKERKLLNSQGRIVDWLSEQQIDEDEVEAAFESFSVQTKVKRAQRTVANYGIESTPQIVVGGRYRLSPTLSGNYQQLLDTMDELIDAISAGNPPDAPDADDQSGEDGQEIEGQTEEIEGEIEEIETETEEIEEIETETEGETGEAEESSPDA